MDGHADQAARGFDAAEYRGRIAALQVRMAREKIAALLLTTEPDILYVTGFLTRFWQSPTRPWFVIVPAAGDPVAVIPAIGAALMAETWITDIRTWNAPQPADDGVTLLADAVQELTPETARIGLMMGPETHLRMPLADFARLRDMLAPRSFVDCADIVHRVREIKSIAEIAAIRATCAAADRAFAAAPGYIRAGRPLTAVFRDFQIALLQGGADWVSYVAGGAGPDGYGDVISPASDTPLMAGDVLMLDTGAVRSGYFCDFDRNFAIGHATDVARRAYEILFAATEAGLAEAGPGAVAGDLHRAMADKIKAMGGTCLGGRLGHGLGLELTEWPSLTPQDRTPIREGMVLTLEPGLQVAPGRIMVAEENIVITADGARLLSRRAPADLPVLK
jgi:Xaa-Pro aminopeptidase